MSPSGVGVPEPPRTSGSSSERVDTAALLAVAHAVEPHTSERTLESWRNQGLLPHAERTGQVGVRPVWTYPAEAVDQLKALLRLRSLSKDPQLLRVSLWFEGYSIPTTRVRSSMIDHLRRMQADLDKELASRATSAGSEAEAGRWEAIGQVARTYARRRSGTPRFGRQFLSAREQAFTVMFGLGLGEPAAVDALDASADDIERALGLDQGRLYRPAGQGPWLTGPAAEGPAMFAEVGSLPNLIETLQSADDAEIEAARPLAYVLLTGLTTFSQIADAFAGYRNAAGIAGLTVFADNLMVRILFPAFVIAFMRSADNAASLVAVCSALSGTILPLKDQLDQLAALSADELTARLSNLDQLPPSRQNSVRRMIESARVTPTDNGADEPDR